MNFAQDTIHIPIEYPTIQAGINAANDNDIVLVAKGTYYENINFKGKTITVASHFLIDGDTSHISKTIIDGSKNTEPYNKVVFFESSENKNTVLTGFTISGGSTGIYIYQSNPSIEYLIIKNNNGLEGEYSGSGIICVRNSDLELNHLNIFNNSSTFYGGGISCRSSKVRIKNSIISNNSSYDGGGINGDYNSQIELSNCIIKENTATDGGGIYCPYEVKFDSINRCSIYLNSAGTGRDLYSIYGSPDISVFLDTFTVIQPTEEYAYPLNKFKFNILHEKINLIDADLYVSTLGNNDNDGLSVSTPLKTISKAISIISSNPVNPRTIHILEGYYSRSSNGESFPIATKPYINLSGQSRNGVVLDAEGLISVIICDNDNSVSIKNLTIKGAGTYEYSSGIKCSNTMLFIDNVTVKENGGFYSSGIYCDNKSKVYIQNSEIKDNKICGIYCYRYYAPPSLLSLINVTITGNKTEGGINAEEGIDELKMESCSVYGNEGYGLRFNCKTAEINNCTIENNNGFGIFSMGDVKIMNSKICYNSPGGGISNGIYGKLTLSNVTIAHNKSRETGGGIANWGSLSFSSRCNIYLNSAIQGNDIYTSGSEPIQVLADTFTVLKPTEYFCSPIEKFSFDILNTKIEQVNKNLYVSPLGDNSNSGLSAAEPLKNISFALAKIYVDELNPRSIFLSDGIYSPSSNNEIYPIVPISNLKIIGSSIYNTILDIEGQGEPSYDNLINPIGILISNQKKITLKNFSITGAIGWNRAIKCEASDSIIIENAEISNNIGGGIDFYNCSSRLKNVTIKGNERLDWSFWYYGPGGGGGIMSIQSDLVLEDVKIINNKAQFGSGIYSGESNIEFNDGVIEENISKTGLGGGIFLYENSNIKLKNVTIRENYAKSGGGIFYGWGNSKLTFDATERCNIYLNHAALGSDFGCPNSEDYNMSNTIDVVLDTFTVLTPTSYNCNPLSNFTFNILNGKLAQIDADLYVSPTGNDLNSGLNVWEPLSSISTALMKIIASSTNPHTIYLANGVYSPSSTNDGFPINLSNYVSLKGASQIVTILNAEQHGSVLHFDSHMGNTVDNLTLMGGYNDYGGGIYCNNSSPSLFNLTLHSNSALYGGSGIYFQNNSNSVLKNILLTHNNNSHTVLVIENSSPALSTVKITNNNNSRGIFCFYSSAKFKDLIMQNNMNEYWSDYDRYEAIKSDYSDLLFENALITDYSLKRDGEILFSNCSNIVFINSTISNNVVNNGSSSILLDWRSNITLINSIIWNNKIGDIKISEDPNNILNIAFSNVYGSQEAIISSNISSVHWLEGNINSSPLFIDTANYNYHLSSKSPCLGAGIDSLQISGVWFYAPKKDLDGNVRPNPFDSRPDIGAYESQLFTDISENGNELPLIFSLYQNYPNPFNGATVIKYSIPNSSRVIIKVYDVLGSEVMTLLNEEKESGYHSVVFNASGLPSGVYFYRIKAGSFVDMKKMILLR